MNKLPISVCMIAGAEAHHIASALDGIPEAFRVGNYGRLVPPEDNEELAAVLRTWAAGPRKNAAERQELHDRIAERFSLPAAASRVLEVYQSLLSPARMPI